MNDDTTVVQQTQEDDAAAAAQTLGVFFNQIFDIESDEDNTTTVEGTVASVPTKEKPLVTNAGCILSTLGNHSLDCKSETTATTAGSVSIDESNDLTDDSGAGKNMNQKSEDGDVAEKVLSLMLAKLGVCFCEDEDHAKTEVKDYQHHYEDEASIECVMDSCEDSTIGSITYGNKMYL